MAASAQKKPAAKSKRVAAGRGAGTGRAVAKRGASGRSGAKRATSRRTAAAKRGTSARNGAKRATSGRKRATSATPRNAGASRVRRNPAPRRETAQESEFISAIDWILSGLGGMFRAYGREIAMAALLILTLCDALTIPAVSV